MSVEVQAVGDYVVKLYMVRIHIVWGRTNDLKGLKFEYVERRMPMVWH
jgi:hypothetical protein